MTYVIICDRSGIDSETVTLERQDIYAARACFDHHVAMAIQHAEWHRVQVMQKPSARNPFPRAIMAYDGRGLDIEVINEEPGDYRWKDEAGTEWQRPTAYAWAMQRKDQWFNPNA